MCSSPLLTTTRIGINDEPDPADDITGNEDVEEPARNLMSEVAKRAKRELGQGGGSGTLTIFELLANPLP